jgi:DNA-binding CsgD family transcriptional regulator
VIESTPDLIETYMSTGHVAEAREELLALERAAARTDNANARAAALRYRGLLDEGGEFEDLFFAALKEHDRLPRPFERARTELCFGERLRRERRKSEARLHLDAACSTFDQLGARLWAERARSELRALGIRVPKPASRRSNELTPQELRVALAVSDGATNRETSAALFLSTKTIEAHLSSIYRKLGVRSRTELASLMARDHAIRRAMPKLVTNR